jgi:CO dehydrogenase/acetyl-CoA synthase beta subunit
VENSKVIGRIREFIEKEANTENKVTIYKKTSGLSNYFKKMNIGVDLDNFKEIILKEETKLELGGINKKSFSLIYPSNELEHIHDGIITLIGPEINEISDESIDFGIFILIGSKEIGEKDFDALRHLSFISSGIEGFMIRTIPRRFWCRISENVITKFSFELLGKAIIYLYKQKFKELINTMEIIIINSYPDLIDGFIEVSSDIRNYIDSKWKDKIEKWKKRIDCDYDWECDACPYYDTCEEVKEVLEERSKMGD